MKMLVLASVFCLLSASVFAAPTRTEERRLSDATAVVQELRDTPDAGIPDDLWQRAQCVVVIPSLKKAAFLIGGETGSGVMSCRHAHGWSAPVFMHLAKGSVGLQIGAEEIDLVLLVMNRRGMDRLLQDKVSLGADASVTAGPVGRVAEAATDARLNAEMLSYSRSHGVFAGIDLSGGVLRADTDVNTRVYGAQLTASDIVGGSRGVVMPAAARPFVRALARDVTATTGKR
jgi:SH3 domain-containing YSC84-like protein 1